MADLRSSIESAVAKGYGLPETGKHGFTEVLECSRTRTGKVYDSRGEGKSRGKVITDVIRLEREATSHGIRIAFKKKWGSHVETRKWHDESVDTMYFYPDSSWCESATRRTVKMDHSYDIAGYKSYNLTDSIEGLGDVSKVREVMGDATAEAAFSILDELYFSYSSPPLFYPAITDSLSGEMAEARKKRTPKTIELFGLDKEETYLGMEELAKAALVEELDEIAIKTEGKWFGNWRANGAFRKAKERYEKNLARIKTVEKQFMERKLPKTPPRPSKG